jgi:hypothetical protein
MSLFFLFWANLVCRCVAIIILTVRESLKYELKHVDEDKMVLNETTNRSGGTNATIPMDVSNRQRGGDGGGGSRSV